LRFFATFCVLGNDAHKSSYNIDFLVKSQPQAIAIQQDRVLWNKANIQTPLNVQCKVTMRDYMSDPEVGKKVLENLYSHGVAFIDGVQPKQENTEFVIRQLFPIHKTLFGEMWTFSDAKKDHNDTAYTNGESTVNVCVQLFNSRCSSVYLGPHNDNTYFNDAAGLQILHCIQFDGTGGENFLIDGFQVAEKLKNENAEVFDRLTKTLLTAEYLEDGRHHKHTAPIIQLDPITGAVEQIRFNLYDRAPFKTVAKDKIRQFYSDLKVLTREIENPENRFTLKLSPGTVMIFDNWRVLHGRLSYTGKRTMTGCYVARTEYQSALRVNQFIN
jgi:trimethyllysine dioxygenase